MLKIHEITIPGIEPITLDVAAGQCIGITGESGCGKTRLLRALADMDENEGEVCVEDVCKREVPAHEWRKRVGLLPAESQWWFDDVGSHFAGDEIPFDALGFDRGVIHWQLSRCSSGEKQRLAILRMLANRPSVLLLDEPTANLDAENTRKVEAMVAEYLEANNAVALWVSHNRQQLERVSSNNCYEMKHGRLVKIKVSG